MDAFWHDHWWLLIPLGAFTIPLAGIALGALATWLHYDHRRKALDALKAYAQHGREPPEELLRQLGDSDDGGGSSKKWDWREHVASTGAAAGAGYTNRWSDPDYVKARTEYYTARAAARAERWKTREPIRRWNNAIFWVVLAVALDLASQHYAYDHVLADRLYIGALIVGALAVAAVLAAILSTLFRPR